MESRKTATVEEVARIVYRWYGSYTFVRGRDPGFDRPVECYACDYDDEYEDCTCSEAAWVVGVWQGKPA